jgi:hypothetical protein
MTSITEPAWSEKTATRVIADWMIAHGYVTGHGDTVDALLSELVSSAREEGYMAAHDADDASAGEDL